MKPEQLAHLFSLTNEYRSIKYDLSNTRALLESLGNPQDSFRSVLIAGTNGKGSVAVMLSAMMPDAGLYTSPHLHRLNERIRIGTGEISDNDLGSAYETVQHAAEEANLQYPPSYFEIVTAMAFLYFKGRVDRAVIEVGLGGRLDATNVVRQDISVITSIDIDHQEFLGSTLEAIASEKAGIIKSDEPVVIGPHADFPVIRERAGDRLIATAAFERRERPLGRGYFEVDIATPRHEYRALRPGLAGRHQIDNVAMAIGVAEHLQVPKAMIEHGIRSATWPGRLERIAGAPAFLLDGAHNEAGARALAAFLAEFYPDGVMMIFGCMADKDYDVMLNLLRPHAREMIFTRAQNSRSKNPEELRAMVPGSRVEPGAREAIAYARSASAPDDTVLICGSLYLIAEASAALKG